MTFGSRLAALRKAKNLTQDGLGKGLGTDGADVGKQVIYGWEKDQHFPRVDQLKLICERLDCSADYLLFGVKAERPTETELQVVEDLLSKLRTGSGQVDDPVDEKLVKRSREAADPTPKAKPSDRKRV